MNKVIRYCVCVVDIGEASDFKPAILDTFTSYTDAQDFAKKDLEKYMLDAEEMGLEADYDELRAWGENGYGCQYSIQKIEIEL